MNIPSHPIAAGRVTEDGNFRDRPVGNDCTIADCDRPPAPRQIGRFLNLGKIGKSLLPIDNAGVIVTSIDDLRSVISRGVSVSLILVARFPIAREGVKSAVGQRDSDTTLFPLGEETQVCPLTVETVTRPVIPPTAPTIRRAGRTHADVVSVETLPPSDSPAETRPAILAINRSKPSDGGRRCSKVCAGLDFGLPK